MTTRIAWIGCGTHANEMLLPQIARLDAAITTICDTDADRLGRTASRFGVPEAGRTRDWLEAIAAPGIDAMAVAAGPVAHALIAKAALARGLPVFVEKPPAATAAEAESLAAASAAAGRPVVVGFMKRYSTANRIAANVIHGEGFGTPASFFGQYMTAPTYFEKDPDYTGFYLHHCVHYLYLVPFLMGPVASLGVRAHELAPGKLVLHLDFRFESSAIGTLVVGTNQSRGTPMEWWQVMADHQRVEVRNVHEVRHVRAPPFKIGRAEASLVDGEDTLVWEPNNTVAANEDHKGYYAMMAAFLAAARGEPVRVPDAADGARAMRLLETMIAGAEAGRRRG